MSCYAIAVRFLSRGETVGAAQTAAVAVMSLAVTSVLMAVAACAAAAAVVLMVIGALTMTAAAMEGAVAARE
jgi:hypothetical protein